LLSRVRWNPLAFAALAKAARTYAAQFRWDAVVSAWLEELDDIRRKS
jgi:hypothetical protein